MKDRFPETHVKMITLGSLCVGKTSLLMKATNPDFECPIGYKGTLGVDNKIKECLYNNTIPVKMHIWDTAGQERFQMINRMYYRDAHATLFVFDLTNRMSLERIDGFWKDFEEFSEAKTHVVKVLVGNKCDMTQREVSKEEGEAWAQAHSVPYFETSAKTGEHISELFAFLLQETMSHNSQKHPESRRLQPTIHKFKRRKCC